MAKSQISQWERNRINIQNAQNRAQSLITELESKGYEVRGELKSLSTKSLNKIRYNKKEADVFTRLLSSTRIKAAASMTVTMMPYNKYSSISADRYKENIKVKYGKESEMLASKTLSNMKYALRYHPSKDVARATYTMLHRMGIKVKIGEEYKTLQKITPKEFSNRFSMFYKSNPNDAVTTMNLFYSQGKSSPKAVKSKISIDIAQSKKTLGSRTNISSKGMDKLYNFFENSVVWDKFRKSYKPSDDYDIYDNIETLTDMLNKKQITTEDIDNMLMGEKDFSKVVNKLLTRMAVKI